MGGLEENKKEILSKFQECDWKITVKRDDGSLKMLAPVSIVDFDEHMFYFRFKDSGKMFTWNKKNIINMLELEKNDSKINDTTRGDNL